MTTADYLAQVLSAPTASYGAEIRILSGSVPRDVRVFYTRAGTPAELLAGTPKLTRGTRLLAVDGVDLVNGGTTQAQIDILNNGTFPRAAGETHTLTVRYPDNTTRTLNLTSANISEAAVNRTAVIPTGTGNVGYILLNTFGSFSAEKAASDAVIAMKAQGVTDVVLDLRYNGGGLLAIASQLSHMVAGPSRTTGKVFERLLFNNFPASTNPVTGGANTPTPFIQTGVGFTVPSTTTLQTLDLPRVFVLTSSGTCSASEAVINGLRGIDVDVVQIGGKTCGKPYGFYAEDNCGRTYFSIQFQGINEKSFGDYADGFVPANHPTTFGVKVPGCSVADDLNHELGDAGEAMLAAALAWRVTPTCPAPNGTGLAPARQRDDALAMQNPTRTEAEEFPRSSRDLRMPGKPAAMSIRLPAAILLSAVLGACQSMAACRARQRRRGVGGASQDRARQGDGTHADRTRRRRSGAELGDLRAPSAARSPGRPQPRTTDYLPPRDRKRRVRAGAGGQRGALSG